jgi:small subunit ribosomal protein S14
MAKKSMIARDAKRKQLVTKFAKTRDELRAISKDPNSTYEQKAEAQIKLQKLPRDSSASRVRNRCRVSGRPHGYFRKFGLSRNKLREATMQGLVPGLVKGSW